MRVLGRIRLSRLTEESTSAARQREIIEQWADANDHEVIGWAEDIDVSGSVDPFEAPALKQWWSREAEWDILCAWKLDRIGRRAIPLNKVFGWMLDHGKTLVCVSDQIDLSHWVGRLVANVIAGVAEGELEAIRERTKASRRKLLEEGRWPGGTVPFGFTPVPLEGGGWKLGHSPAEIVIIRRVVDQICDGESVSVVADTHSMLPQTVWNMVTSKYLLGHATYEGRTVRDRKGQPVLNAEPVLTQDEWDRLQKAVAARRQVQTRTAGVSVMHGVAFCPVCDHQLYSRRYKATARHGEYRYYFCPNRHGRNIPAAKVEKLVFDTFLEEFGDQPVLDRVYVPAEDHQIELEAAERAVEELSALVGTMTSQHMRTRLTEQMRALDLEIARLEATPSREAGWAYEETGQTFADVWPTATAEQKRKMIIDAGITARLILKTTQIDFYIEVTQKSPSAS
jgi:DNA invertase Pin-like site-specific DNA recombinase